ncbi:hypothetical protein NBRC116188_00390 [Oceaniserpentilla sp. 4NH20-0058]|uniref:hypothetical protein n=1 Tax=Oceaniserpentilla sp. 4NH20-0058 TaxID=3127660 RepID=UPI00310311A3
MLLRLLITAMMLLAIAKFYLHDNQQAEKVKPAQQLEDVKTQLKDIKNEQEAQQQKYLEQIGR